MFLKSTSGCKQNNKGLFLGVDSQLCTKVLKIVADNIVLIQLGGGEGKKNPNPLYSVF